MTCLLKNLGHVGFLNVVVVIQTLHFLLFLSVFFGIVVA